MWDLLVLGCHQLEHLDDSTWDGDPMNKYSGNSELWVKHLSILFLLAAGVPERSRECLLLIVPVLVREMPVLTAYFHVHGAALDGNRR